MGRCDYRGHGSEPRSAQIWTEQLSSDLRSDLLRFEEMRGAWVHGWLSYRPAKDALAEAVDPNGLGAIKFSKADAGTRTSTYAHSE